LYQTQDHPIKDRWKIGEYAYQRCPKSTVDDDTWFWIMAYNFYKSGQLPNSSGWLDQANKYNEVMLYIYNKKAEHQRDKNGRK
jgi:hypothetical protein